MSVRSLIVVLLALCASATCLGPEYHCRIICNDQNPDCPEGYQCNMRAERCVLKDSPMMCPLLDGTGGSGGSTPLPDAAPDSSLDTPTLVPDAAGPGELCYGNSCITLSTEMRQSLVFWLDPSNLPAPGQPVARWPDRSSEGNDAYPLPARATPRARPDGVDMPSEGGPLVMADDRSLDFAAEDFSILIVARVTPLPSCFFAKANFDRLDPRGIVLGWTYSTDLGRSVFRAAINGTVLPTTSFGLTDMNPHVFVLRRTGDAAEARVDGAGNSRASIPAGLSASAPGDAFVGNCAATGVPLPTLHAAIGFRGPIPTADLARLEAFLLASFPRVP